MKCCVKCLIEKDDAEFYSGRNVCRLCRKEKVRQYKKDNQEKIKEQRKQYYQKNAEPIKEKVRQYKKDNQEKIKQYRQNNLEKRMFVDARRRAKKKKVPFDIEIKDIVIPSVCPVLGIALESGIGKGIIQTNSPSLDRIIPEKGYVKGNIIVISNKANMMKSDATPEEMIKLGEFAKKLLEEANKKG